MSTERNRPDEKDVLTVGRLTDRIKALLEGRFRSLWVEGELSNLTRHGSGHWYFTLKDDRSQIQAVMFRSANARVSFRPEPGMKVLVRGAVTVYPPRGNYQIRVERMLQSGLGELQQAFEALKKKLQAEGLFDESRKRPIPFLPRRVGIVTSPTGAAIRDIINVATRRFPNMDLLLCPARVQGEGAAEEVARAIERIDAAGDCDVLIVGRGGGSLEDLWAFNEECVARAIFACRTPVISAVGHEIDFTIADFTADLRAPTPSAAAELAVPEKAALIAELDDLRGRLGASLRSTLDRARRLFASSGLGQLRRRPRELIEFSAQRLDELTDRLTRATLHQAELRKQKTLALLEKVAALNPVETLRRGFSVTTLTGTGRVVRRTTDVQPGDRIDVKVTDGRIRCTVDALALEDLNGQGKIF